MFKLVTKETVFPAVAVDVSPCRIVPTSSSSAPKVEVGVVQVNPDVKLHHMVYRPAHPKGTVLFLHGFPETMYAWRLCRVKEDVTISRLR